MLVVRPGWISRGSQPVLSLDRATLKWPTLDPLVAIVIGGVENRASRPLSLSSMVGDHMRILTVVCILFVPLSFFSVQYSDLLPQYLYAIQASSPEYSKHP
ncbi:uncharacterized protein N7484_007866 [Penicillium longicatenatum]|uniref:uncharacterized protein n=1 Tax=Penicillium longicatenatum TaxID=1561947 RepID=UPI002549BE46|nr:uncharacterized protein N7484_007866 [Penicillium longicatenatum]KAJ5640004.1 hypothetical protein N7484_007866 [Penicillium longicatenatum]